MTFHQRALMLKDLAKYLMERKEEFYALSAATGATRTDSWIDIEGGIGTLFAYASSGRRELPNTRLLVEGAPEVLSKDNSFVGQHILTPLEGTAVHINAFNFPCWGMLEKLAPTLVAGMPAVIKPASQTAYLTELMVALAAPALADIKIGSTLAQTGPASFLGDPEAKTLEMLVAETNANGGINGEKIELIMYDDGADPNKARTFATRLVEDDEVVAVIGGSTTGTTMAMRSFAARSAPLRTRSR